MRRNKRKLPRELSPGSRLCQRVKGLLFEKGYHPYRLSWQNKGSPVDALCIFRLRNEATGGDFQQKAVLVRLTRKDRVWVRVFVDTDLKPLIDYLRTCAGTQDVRFGTVPLSHKDWKKRIHPEDLEKL